MARVLLMPSRWPEPFGRIPVEAGISGIPTLVADRGGLPEAVGVPGLVAQENTWRESVEQVLSDIGMYRKKVKQAAEERMAAEQVQLFRKVAGL